MSVRQYVISNPPSITFRHYIKETNGTPSVVWQQQIENALSKTYKEVHSDRPDRYYDFDYTKDIETQFRPLSLVKDYNPHYIDPEYGRDLYWDDEIYDKPKLQIRCDDYPPSDDEDNPEPDNSKLSRALIELWQLNTEAISEKNRSNSTARRPWRPTKPLRWINLLAHFSGKGDRTMIYSPFHQPWTQIQKADAILPNGFRRTDIGRPNRDWAYSSAIPEADLRKIRLPAPQSIAKEGPASSFQIMVANGDIETPKKTVELKFEVWDIEFNEIFIVMEKLSSPITGLFFLQTNHTVVDMRQKILNFLMFSWCN